MAFDALLDPEEIAVPLDGSEELLEHIVLRTSEYGHVLGVALSTSSLFVLRERYLVATGPPYLFERLPYSTVRSIRLVPLRASPSRALGALLLILWVGATGALIYGLGSWRDALHLAVPLPLLWFGLSLVRGAHSRFTLEIRTSTAMYSLPSPVAPNAAVGAQLKAALERFLLSCQRAGLPAVSGTAVSAPPIGPA